MKAAFTFPTTAQIAPKTTEWPTVSLIALHWLAFFGLTFFYHSIPWWLALPVGGCTLALFGSLQHEVLHGHPTPHRWLNEAMVFPNIALWIPYSIYKQTHLAHHINEQLTQPNLDPESFYICPKKWQQYPTLIKAYYRFYNTVTGRFFWGPIHSVTAFWRCEVRGIFSGNRQALWSWVIHSITCLTVLYWVIIVCGIPFWEYVMLFIYPGIALTLLRSFIEHQALQAIDERSIIVETNPLLSLIFLNNNLHAIHHKEPHLAWYKIPWIW